MPKKEFDKLLEEDFDSIKKKVKSKEYGDRILNRMKNCFQLGANEKIEFFLNEIGLNIGQVEKEAIRARNIMIHSKFGVSDEEIERAIRFSDTYKTYFHRVFLKILGFEGKYVDYTILGWPEKDINEVVG